MNLSQNVNYKIIALVRIHKTRELNHLLGHLKNRQWKHDEIIWKWLAEAPLSDILYGAIDLQQKNLKAVSYHEAGHAVIAAITYQDIISATIIPNPFSNSAGEVVTEADYPPLNVSMINSGFWSWRLVVQWLAGLASEEYILDKIASKYQSDIKKL